MCAATRFALWAARQTTVGGINPFCITKDTMALPCHLVTQLNPLPRARHAFFVPYGNHSTSHPITPPSRMPAPPSSAHMVVHSIASVYYVCRPSPNFCTTPAG